VERADEINGSAVARQVPRPRERSVRVVLILVLLLVVLAVTCIGLDMHAWRGRKAMDARIFQRATGGLGMGAIASPIWQFINYDARVLSVDDSITWPVPGGYSFGPDRTGTVSCFRELADDQWTTHGP
jgi:hypothetical protein